MFNRIFNSQAKTVTSAAGILALSALISRFLGLIRDRLLAGHFGAGPDLDIYFAAFRIPDLVYNVLIAGGIVVAFLPLFSEYFSKNKEDSWQFTNNVLNIFLFFLILISLILFIFTPALIKLVAPGFDLEQKNLTILLTRLMFLSPIFFGLSSIFSGILQYFNRFLVYGLCPILYNLGIILGIIFFAPYFGVLGVALGVILGAAFHFLIQIPSAISCGFRYKPIFNFRDPGIRRVFSLMIPRTFGVAAQQINFIVITAIASTLAAGSIAIFNFSKNLQYIPVGIIGVSFAVASFPALSKAWAEAKKEEFIKEFSSIFRKILYLIIPFSVLMFILAPQIIKIILETGQFGRLETHLTSTCLALFCLGIFAFALIPLIFRAFFAFQNTKIPTLIAILGMILNIGLCFILVWLLNPAGMLSASYGAGFQNFIKNTFSLQEIEDISVIGLPLAFSVAGIFQFILLMIFLYKKIGDYKLKEIFLSFSKILIASILMAGIVYLLLPLLATFLDIQTFWGVFFQTVIAGFMGVLIYILTTSLLKSPEIKAILKCFAPRSQA